MAILFDRDFGRVWSDGTTPYLFTAITRTPQKRELDELAEKQIEMIGELKHSFHDVYAILDLRLCSPVTAPFVRHYISRIVPRQFKIGLKHEAFVVPREKKAKEVLIHALISIDHLSISLHSSFENALNEINHEWTRAKPVKQKSRLSIFLETLGIEF
jgi:hypothetical protein